ncbi:NB-ARC domain-containing protein [Abeliophyllum distichum]|uniref:NB-ARC domain-containing protein n=1 Tax=Abeliophyllum distichum TaxID=126358 RepID=A0ABD1UJ84_9LAMI
MEIEEKSGIQDLQPRNFSLGAGSPKPAAPSGKITVVGLDDDLMEIKTRLVRESRELEIVSHVGMGGIGKDESWNLFCDKVFGEDCCPPELEEIRKKIAQNCRGLPLAVVVIGASSQRPTEHEIIGEMLLKI